MLAFLAVTKGLGPRVLTQGGRQRTGGLPLINRERWVSILALASSQQWLVRCNEKKLGFATNTTGWVSGFLLMLTCRPASSSTSQSQSLQAEDDAAATAMSSTPPCSASSPSRATKPSSAHLLLASKSAHRRRARVTWPISARRSRNFKLVLLWVRAILKKMLLGSWRCGCWTVLILRRALLVVCGQRGGV